MSISELLHLENSFVIVLKFENSEIQRIIYDINDHVQEIIYWCYANRVKTLA